MKTSKFIFLGFLFLFFAINVNAQTISSRFDNEFDAAIMCDGVVDIMHGQVSVHVLFHYNKIGQVVFEKVHSKGEAVLESTGEVFDVHYMETSNFDVSWNQVVKFNSIQHYIGNMGTHYVCYYTWVYDPLTDELTYTHSKILCL